MKYFIITLLILFCVSSISGQGFDKNITPSVYYTSGNYSDERTSGDISAYITYNYDTGDNITAGFQNLEINHPEWNYDQNMFVAGITQNMFPYYFYASGAYQKGEFTYLPYPDYYDYTDKTYTVNLGFSRNVDFFYFGGGMTYSSFDGWGKLEVIQPYLTAVWVASGNVTLSLSPVYSATDDGRDLFAGTATMVYQFAFPLTLTGSFTLGKRVYYYDPVNYTFFNQIETQKTTGKLSLGYGVTGSLRVNAAYRYSVFDRYKISYFTAGAGYTF